MRYWRHELPPTLTRASLEAWIDRVEAKDAYTSGHSVGVANYAVRLGVALDCDRPFLDALEIACLLHDVGKLAVPVEVLNKRGPLTHAEWEVIRVHPTTGESIASDLGLPAEVREPIRCHHEHWDGSGYPDGLADTDIPLAARIVTVADVFDALTKHRAYRPALSFHEALRVMRTESGHTLDPHLYGRFEEMLLHAPATVIMAGKAETEAGAEAKGPRGRTAH